MSKKSTAVKNWREERRMQAWKLHQQGWKQRDIATALGVTEGAVSQWFKCKCWDYSGGMCTIILVMSYLKTAR